MLWCVIYISSTTLLLCILVGLVLLFLKSVVVVVVVFIAFVPARIYERRIDLSVHAFRFLFQRHSLLSAALVL